MRVDGVNKLGGLYQDLYVHYHLAACVDCLFIALQFEFVFIRNNYLYVCLEAAMALL
jgi:hypothetical protein